MAVYSHSKLSVFEECKYKYKLKYIDFVRVKTKKVIFFVVGIVVHEVLEELYKKVLLGEEPSLFSLKSFFEKQWKKHFSADAIDQNEKNVFPEEYYKKLAWAYIKNYFNEYKPFKQMDIIGVETKSRLRLGDGSLYDVRIDKLARKDNTFFVCDYKTNISMKEQSEADSDRQLAMYASWVKQNFLEANNIVLLWHMLAFNKEVKSMRTEKDLLQVEEKVVELIKEIELTKDFPAKKTKNCIYCDYKEICYFFGGKSKQKNIWDYSEEKII